MREKIIFMKQMIFALPGMQQMLVFDTSKPKIRNRATGFDENKKEDDYSILTTGDGGIFSKLMIFLNGIRRFIKKL